jgi:hypothetical protein
MSCVNLTLRLPIRAFCITLVCYALSFSLLGCGESAPSRDIENPLRSIKISPAVSTINIGEDQNLKAVGTYKDGSIQTITDLLQWTVSPASKATVVKGKVTGIAAGEVTVVAKLGNISAKATVTVELAALESISITPVNPSIAKGTSQDFVAIAHRADGSTDVITDQVTWGSSDEDIATISNAPGFEGKAASNDLGLATITATLGSVSGNAILTVTDAEVVSIEISPSTISIADDTQTQFTALGTFTDGSTQDVTEEIAWETSDENIATISNSIGFEGLATGVDIGSVTITGFYEDVISDEATLTVTSATLVSIAVTPANPSIAKGLDQQFVATGTYDDASTQDLTELVTWSSSDVGVATISNVTETIGLASSVTEGTSTITATFGAVSGDTLLTVDPAELVSIAISPLNSSIRNGTLKEFLATGTYTDDTTQDITADVTWSSSDIGVATISNAGGEEGIASSVSAGDATITATLGAVSSNTTLTVLPVTLTSIDVTPDLATIANGTSLQFIATGTFDDASTQDLTEQVTWSSSDMGVATISNIELSKGQASSVVDGSTTITATLGSVFGTEVLNVSPATLISIEVTPDTPTVVDGNSIQFTATGTFSDASTQDITNDVVWSSSDVGVATIGNDPGYEGLADSVTDGPVTITATLGAVSDSTDLTVSPAELVSIGISPVDPTVGVGVAEQFTATGIYTDESTQDITTLVTWSSSDTNVATISNTGGSEGLSTAIAEGETTISATLGLISADTTLTVELALDYVTITPTTSTLQRRTSRKLKGTAFYTDGSSLDVTNVLTRWASSNNAIIKINQNNKPGKIRALTSSGTATITFTYTEDGVTRSATLDVTAVP